MTPATFDADNCYAVEIEISMKRGLAPRFCSLLFQLDDAGFNCEGLCLNSQLSDFRCCLAYVLKRHGFDSGGVEWITFEV